ncbi:MAG: hypothetical protein A2017_06180 [Lentisphaerae bacterium GWF2_44_16]|nr:MAG: hypothetical protein A2017_06180 [Lentisphaerae bacterium GWF2_44_16]
MDIIRKDVKKRMSRIVIHNGTVYLCGQVANERTPDIRQQTRGMLENVQKLLDSAGSSRDKILSATVYLKNMGDFQAMNEIWDEWIPEGQAPARACVQAKMAYEEVLVEISIIAAL